MNFYLLFLFISISIFWLIISQISARLTTGFFIEKIRLTIKELIKIKNLSSEDLIGEQNSLEIILEKKKHLSFITVIIGVIEFIFFFLVSFSVFLQFKNDIYDLSPILQIFGGWLAIKTIGNYNQWASPIFGRAFFYTFFTGTLVNISFAVLLGLAWVLLILNI